VSYSAIGYFQYLYSCWMEYYFKDILKLDANASRLYSTIVTGSMAAGIVLGGRITDAVERRGRPRVVVPVTGMILSAAFLLVGALGRDTAWVVACFSLALACVGVCESPFWVTATALGGRSGGIVAAVMNTGGNAGGKLAP
jgi:MFS family permease